uniref:PI MADS box protein n=1 Tax=Ribes diacantha TaxID=207520 RepID=S5RCJ8_9MAGN|nr:PI MADS box protein [Ribes diacanthum]AHY19022.1 PI MADS box protein [Ribes diacanthum]
MGRGKIEIKRIENQSNRQVTYTKRRNGIIKKAKEITVLCDAHVSLVIFASNGKMHEYCSPSTTLVDILGKYHKQSGKKLWDAKHENLSNEIDRVKKENDNMQIELRHLKGEDITSLHHKELMAIEETLENGVDRIRKMKDEVVNRHRKNYQKEDEEHKYLNYVLNLQHQKEMAFDSNTRGMNIDDGYHLKMRGDYNSQMPFAFRVQPIQPNLQERI